MTVISSPADSRVVVSGRVHAFVEEESLDDVTVTMATSRADSPVVVGRRIDAIV